MGYKIQFIRVIFLLQKNIQKGNSVHEADAEASKAVSDDVNA